MIRETTSVVQPLGRWSMWETPLPTPPKKSKKKKKKEEKDHLLSLPVDMYAVVSYWMVVFGAKPEQ